MSTKDFSDAELTVDGVTVKPTWPWSKAVCPRAGW